MSCPPSFPLPFYLPFLPFSIQTDASSFMAFLLLLLLASPPCRLDPDFDYDNVK